MAATIPTTGAAALRKGRAWRSGDAQHDRHRGERARGDRERSGRRAQPRHGADEYGARSGRPGACPTPA